MEGWEYAAVLSEAEMERARSLLRVRLGSG